MDSPTSALHAAARRPHPQSARSHIIEAAWPSIRQAARAHSRRWGLTAAHHADELVSVVAEAALHLVDQLLADPERALAVRDLGALICTASESATRQYAHSELGHAPAAGMHSTLRRRGQLERLRSEMEARGLDPSNAELVAEHNRRVAASRSDAARQGALASLDDLAVPVVVGEADDAAQPVDECVIDRTEMAWVIDTIGTRAAAEFSERAGAVARAWLSPILSGDEPASVDAIASALGLSPRTARRDLHRVRALAPGIARSLGIDAVR